MTEKKFGEDLFFAFGEFMISIPPFKDRIEDIPYLAKRFCNEAATELKKNRSLLFPWSPKAAQTVSLAVKHEETQKYDGPGGAPVRG
ncbi:MAG TPA: hypothetical protein VEI57_13470 [Nitrospirota bacterium]|nr:hypothetical protein [Nitrospirota bacterium]